MTHTGATLASAGGFEEAKGVFGALDKTEGVPGGVSDVFALLGKEMDRDPKIVGNASGARKRGRSLEEVVKGAGRAIKRRREGGDGGGEGEGEGELKLTWRGSWT